MPLALAALPLIGALALSIWLYATAASHMPPPRETVFLDLQQGQTQFYDASGARLIHKVADPLGERREWLKLEDLPGHLRQAALMAEAQDEGSAGSGFNPWHALLQVWRYIIGAPLEAEDSISGKLTRDALLPLAKEGGLDEDLLEIVLVSESKRLYSADELLEWRLNSAYYGRDAIGIEAAAQVYLGKSARTLSLAEAALLAAVVDEPAGNPLDAPAIARQRSADLLFALFDAEWIDQAQFDEASAAAFVMGEVEARGAQIAPDFIAYARQQAEDILDRQGYDGARLMARGALRITTSLDMNLQLQAECLMRAHLAGAEPVLALDGAPCEAARLLTPSVAETGASPEVGALALLDVRNGKLLSMVGEAQAARYQPAIVLQPFIYLDAFLRREFTPASMVYDLPQAYPGPSAELIYTPANPDGQYRGPLNLRDAMAAGLIPPAAQVASGPGIAPALRAAQALGFNSLNASRHGLELLERGGAVSTMDAAYAYSVLASLGAMRGLPAPSSEDGFRSRDPVAILRIEDARGRVLWSFAEGEAANSTAIIQPSAAYMVNDILADAEARAAVAGEGAARLAAVPPGGGRRWHERRQTQQLDGRLFARSRTGGAYGPRRWRAARPQCLRSRRLGAGLALADGIRPCKAATAGASLAPAGGYRGVSRVRHFRLAARDHVSLPDAARDSARGFTIATRSLLADTFEINRTNGQLATVNTPDALREAAAYFIPPDEIMEWWIENGKPLPPSSYSTDGGARSAKPARLIRPADYAYVGATVAITAETNRADAVWWQLEYGAEVNPAAWLPIGPRRAVDESGDMSTKWETALFSGIYTLRLSVTFADGSVETDTRLLTFDNTPPAVNLRTSDGAREVAYPARQVVSLLADVSDNLAIARVEFYRDEALLGVDRDWPYGYDFEIAGAGEILFKARAIDQVGNQAASELLITVIEG